MHNDTDWYYWILLIYAYDRFWSNFYLSETLVPMPCATELPPRNTGQHLWEKYISTLYILNATALMFERHFFVLSIGMFGCFKTKTYFLEIVWALESLEDAFAGLGSCLVHKRFYSWLMEKCAPSTIGLLNQYYLKSHNNKVIKFSNNDKVLSSHLAYMCVGRFIIIILIIQYFMQHCVNINLSFNSFTSLFSGNSGNKIRYVNIVSWSCLGANIKDAWIRLVLSDVSHYALSIFLYLW